MHEPPITRAGIRAPIGLLGMLLLVASGEKYVARHDLHFSNPTPAAWRFSAREADRRTETGGILCFGTSLVKYGVVPRILEQETGRRAFNLAVCNGHMPSSYYLFKRTLDSGVRPAAVVVDCQDGPVPHDQVGAQAEALRVNLRHWPELLRWGEAIDLARTARDGRFLADWAASRLLPSYKARFEVRNAVQASLRGVSGSSALDVVSVRRNWNVNRGAQLMPRNPAPPVDPPALPPVDTAVAEADFRRSSRRNKITDIYINRFVELAAEHGVRVFWVLPPLSPRKRLERDRAGMTGHFTRQAERLRAARPWVTVVDARSSGFASAVFWDDVHLDRHGAGVFSLELGRAIGRVLDGPPEAAFWVNLPPFRDQPDLPPAEDVFQSRAIAAEGPRRVVR